jgi:3-isopropylmalate/(R)-2-methylmalate dehydratase large subunit
MARRVGFNPAFTGAIFYFDVPAMKQNLYNKVFDRHVVSRLSSGQYQVFIGLHLVHEVTSPQAFALIRERGLKVRFPNRTFATVDHIIPTDARERKRPLLDSLAEEMLQAIEKNTAEFGVNYFGTDSGRQGIVHVIGPELGLTQPGMTIACGDSHTSTHGAFGSLAFGIGTSQVADILATQTMSLGRLKVRKIQVNGRLGPGVYAKDVILAIIRKLGVNGGVGYAYEYTGDVISNFTMEERMTLCNMSIEGGARIGYVNPDETTFAYLKGRPHAPQGSDWDKAVEYWRSVASDSDATFDDVVTLDGSSLAPHVTWGITPGQSLPVDGAVPSVSSFQESEQQLIREALEYMDLKEGQKIEGVPVDVVFIGSCTNGRISDLEEAARVVKGMKVASGVKALVVPGSEQVEREAEAKGLPEVFRAAGFEWREPGCSMCLAMNPDKLKDRQISASTSNRNFKGRQGSPSGRTLLMSPVMAAAAAVTGKVADARKVFRLG